MPERPRVLIEQWLPIAEIGAECMRERGASSALPPLYFLHVWWARRPLTVSRAAILASLLPAYPSHEATSDSHGSAIRPWPKTFLTRFPTEDAYRAWFLRLIGIYGDPVAARRLIEWQKRTGKNTPGNKYGYPRAFTCLPSEDQLTTLYDLIEWVWGTRDITFCDPMSGGGSIPFEALRLGLRVHANELNPVASVVLLATLDYPARFGPSLAADIRKYGNLWCDRVRKELKPFYPEHPPTPDGSLKGGIHLWARTVACPVTGKPVPLSPNWWLQKGSEPVAVKLIADVKDTRCRFEVVRGKTACERAKPDQGTIKGGTGRSPWTGEAIDGDYIKREAQAGRMGQQLYAVEVFKGHSVFRAPAPDDEPTYERALRAVSKLRPQWEAQAVIPSEPRREGRADWACELYGATRWCDTYTPRQLLAMVTMTKVLAEVSEIAVADIGQERARAVRVYLALAIDKAADYNSKQIAWHSSRQVVVHAFARHDLSMRWSFAEFDASRNLCPWAIDQIHDAFLEIAKLSTGPATELLTHNAEAPIKRLRLTTGPAQSLRTMKRGEVTCITVDPPYYDNVNYAECSNYFYVWMKRTVGDVFDGLFSTDLANEDDEAIMNVARFKQAGKKAKELATADYENKMMACFKEMNRILAPSGVLTVMFTHKQVEAWDTLGTALLRAGFQIDAAWPVQTESDSSLHQAKKNAAASTIMLVCRKRDKGGEPVWWDDLKGKVRRAAREAAERFEQMGIAGVDLYISTFGPVLSVISENWPVLTSQTDPKTGDPMPLRPGDALDLARAEVVALRKQGLLLGRAVDFDPVTDWVLMAWDAFKAGEFPADEARKLALALGLDLEATIVKDKKLVAKKQSTVVLNEPISRRKKGMVDPDADTFVHVIDAVHTAMMVYDEDGAKACGAFLKKHELRNDTRLKACIEAMMKAIPTTRDKKGGFVRPEMETLEALRLAFFDDLPPPKEEEVPKVETQGTLGDFAEVAADGDSNEDDDDAEE